MLTKALNTDFQTIPLFSIPPDLLLIICKNLDAYDTATMARLCSLLYLAFIEGDKRLPGLSDADKTVWTHQFNRYFPHVISTPHINISYTLFKEFTEVMPPTKNFRKTEIFSTRDDFSTILPKYISNSNLNVQKLFELAIKNEQIQILSFLLDKYRNKINIEAEIEQGKTPLFYALVKFVDAVELEIDKTNKNNWKPATILALDVVTNLVDFEASKEIALSCEQNLDKKETYKKYLQPIEPDNTRTLLTRKHEGREIKYKIRSLG